MRIEDNWSDGGVFLATLKMIRNKEDRLSEIQRVFTFKDCFTKKEACSIILEKFPGVESIVHIEYIESCHILKNAQVYK